MKARILQSIAVALALLLEQRPVTAQEQTGQEVVQEIRSAVPEGNVDTTGTLMIRRKDKTRVEVPVWFHSRLTNGGYESVFQAAPAGDQGEEKLIVFHHPQKPNQYFFSKAAKRGEPLPEPKPLSATDIGKGFAGSDFSYADLGLDFLHWPEQKRLKGEMRLGRPCHVIESKTPTPVGNVAKIVSWIDKETGGILIAEGYDQANNRVKEFSLSGSSFRKVKGVWQLEEMKIRSPQSGSQTVLKFNLKE
jgi:hypothetical protein